MTLEELLADPVGLFAVVYALATAVVVAFQLGVAVGKPWGEYTMGGRWRGRLPPAMRLAALMQAFVLVALAGLVIDTAGITDLGWADRTPWLPWVPAVVSAIAFVLNASSRSELEKRLWVPVAIVMLVCSIAVAGLSAAS